MDTVTVKQILTHHNPDLDAILSVLLLKRFGEQRFPGSGSAEVIFCSAGQLPDGKTAEELEKEGVLAVDVGGGRLDTHPAENRLNDEKRDRCAADLVAEAVGVLKHPAWSGLIEFTRQHDTEGRNIQSSEHIHQLPTILTILIGLQLRQKDNDTKSEIMLQQGIELLDLAAAGVENGDSRDETADQVLLLELVNRYFEYNQIDIEDPPSEYASFAEWRRRLSVAPESAFSADALDKVISLLTILKGLRQDTHDDNEQIWERIRLYLDAIAEREQIWANAITQFDNNAIIEKVGKRVYITGIASENGMVIKAARFRKRADIIIYRDPSSGATTVLVKRNGPLKKFSMQNMASKIRLAECVMENSKPEYPRLGELGMIHGWFMHQSENLLIRGSDKASKFKPSRLPLEKLMAITSSEVDWQQKLPLPFCPESHCTQHKCAFYSMHYPTCGNHRARCDEMDTTTQTDKKKKIKRGSSYKPPVTAFGEMLRQALDEKSKKTRRDN